MATTVVNTNGGTTVSFGNTPQASDDLFTAAQTGLSDGSLGTVVLDVMADDGGGKAKSLWSLDDGVSAAAPTTNGNYSPNDLLAKDAVGAANFSENGATIKITADGKVSYDASTLSADFKTALQHLGVGESTTDTFTYAIRLGNGTLSWAEVTVQIAGTNDGPVISVVSDGEGGNPDDSDSANLTESNVPLGASGTLTVTDIDDSDAVSMSVIEAAGSVDSGYDIVINEGLDEAVLSALFAIDPATLPADTGDVNNLSWTFDSNPLAFDFLQGDETLTLTYTIQADDGHGLANSTDTHEVIITIAGTNDLAEFSGDDTGDVFEDGVEIASGTLNVADLDHDEGAFASTSSLSGSYGAFTFDLVTGAWTYDLDNDNPTVQGLNDLGTLTDTLTVTSVDLSTHDIVVTINGANELGGGGGEPANQAPTDVIFVPTQTGSSLQPLGHFVGIDPDAGDTFTYSFTFTGLAGSGVTVDATTGDLSLPTQNSNATSGTVTVTATDQDLVSSPATTFTLVIGANGSAVSTETVNAGATDDNIEAGRTGLDTLNGSAGVDYILGGPGADTLSGFGGADVLLGGAGNDFYRFNLTTDGIDQILDFNVADDTIQLDNASFTQVGADGTLAASAFVIGAAAADASDRIVYDSTTGALYYDADGTGITAAIQFASMSTGVSLTNNDFQVI